MKNKRGFKKVLITGISGSGGSYLAEYIAQHHSEVKIYGISRWHSTTSLSNLGNVIKKVKVLECDLNDFSSVLTVLKAVKPDAIFHLAAHANVRASFITPISVLSNNIGGTVNLLEAIRILKINPVVQLCSTSEVYGQVDPKNVPINEDCPISPTNPYAVSKLAQDMLGLTYFRSYKMKIIRTRMFAYINPRREDLFATSFAKQVAMIEVGLKKELLHGNLDSVRTLIDVRDAMESYWVASQQCEFGEVYNIGGNTVIKVGEFLDILKKKSLIEFKSRVDKKLLRPTDVTLQIPDISKFKKATGWKPKYTFEQSVGFLLDYWREEIRRRYMHQAIEKEEYPK